MYSFPNKEGASVESFPTAFAIPIGLVKLVQGLWLLDHNDHQVKNKLTCLYSSWIQRCLGKPNSLCPFWRQMEPHYLHSNYIYSLIIDYTWVMTSHSHDTFLLCLIRAHLSCCCIQLPLSASLSGSTSVSCRPWCVRVNTQWLYVTSTLRSLQLLPHPKPNSACLYCYKTSKNKWKFTLNKTKKTNNNE